MPKKTKETERNNNLPEAPAREQPITETIEKNYMPYAMTVIISRALPEIDGFKPSQRKLLYTMYKMGLMTGNKVKSTNVVGQTMRLNPHGDAAIYDTLVRLTRGNETLLHPFVDSKGSWGKQYSTDMVCAASRYTECKLDKFCAELFDGIDKNAVDMVDNFDNTMKEPTLLPTTFPNILVSPNAGIAVGMACKFCSFNLAEICDGTIELLENPYTDCDKLLDIIKAPDFAGGGYLLYDRAQMLNIYKTGTGSFKLRAKYRYDKSANCIDVLQIPYSTSIELIMKSISELVKSGKVKEITDFRDETDKNGLKLTIDIKRGTDPDKLMAKLYKLTPLEDSFACNFNLIIGGAPYTLGIDGILKEWIKFRMECVKRQLTYDKAKKEDKYHLLIGLSKILLDIDKAVRIVRGTENEADVVPNLMRGFDIDEKQGEFIAEIKLRNFNKEYILNRIKEIEDLDKDIKELASIISSDAKVKKYIVKQLKTIKEKYGMPRKTEIVYNSTVDEYDDTKEVENYNCHVILTKEGYFKKNTLVSLRASDEQKFKDDDYIVCSEDCENIDSLLFFSDKAQVYKAKVDDFEPVKASLLGDYIPAKLSFDEGENVVFMKVIKKYNETDNFLFVFENGKCAKVPASSYETKSNRKKLSNAYSDSSPIASIVFLDEDKDVFIGTDQNRAIVVNTSLISQKATRTSQGITVLKNKKNEKTAYATERIDAVLGEDGSKGFRKNKIPAPANPFGKRINAQMKKIFRG